MQMNMRNQVILTSLHWKSRQNIDSWSRRNGRVTCPLINSCSCGFPIFFCGGRTSLVGRANPSPHWVRGRVTSQSHNDWQPPINQLCKHRRAGIGTQNLQIPWNCSNGSFGLWISVGFTVVCCNCRILKCFVFGAATCSQPLASSGVAERKTPSALQLPCRSSRCPKRDSDGNCTRLVRQNSELPMRKVTSSSFSFLLRSQIPSTRLKIPPCSHFPFIYFSSKALFTLLQLSSAPVSWRKGPLALVFPWQQGCGWSPRSGWKHPEVCRDGAAFLSDALLRNLAAALHRGAIFSNKPVNHVWSPENGKRWSCSTFWWGGVERDLTEAEWEFKEWRKVDYIHYLGAASPSQWNTPPSYRRPPSTKKKS